MRGILRGLRRIGADIVAGKNLEAYAVSALAIVVAILGVLDEAVKLNVQMAAILAALGLLVFKTTKPEQQSTDLDSVLLDRQSYGPFRDFIRGARELWIYGPSAINVLHNAPDIKLEVLDKGGRVRVLLQDPEEQHGMDVLHHQLDKISDLENDIQSSLIILKRMATTWKTPGTVEHGLLPYNPGFSIVIVDPDGRDGRLTIEFYGFENELISDRMHIVITRQQSQYWFEYWARQYEKMWDVARQTPLPE